MKNKIIKPRDLTTIRDVALELGVSVARIGRVVGEYKISPWFERPSIRVFVDKDFDPYREDLKNSRQKRSL